MSVSPAFPARRRSILRRNPYSDRRSFIARAMALEPIGDIADVSLSAGGTTETLTWNTGTDWDNAADEEGVVHESNTNTDWPGDSTIALGYPSTDTDLAFYYPFHEDSGSTIHDLANNADVSLSSPTFNEAGPGSGSSVLFDGVDDSGVDSGFSVSMSLPHTVALWYETTGTDYDTILKFEGSSGYLRLDHNVASAGKPRYWFTSSEGNVAVEPSSGSYNDGNWHVFVARRTGTSSSDVDLWIDGTDVGENVLRSGTQSGITVDTIRWAENSSNRYWDGNLAEFRYWNRALSTTEAAALDIRDGYLTSATKSFSASGTPDLQNLSYSLNGQSITLDVIGSPGQAGEETISQTLDGSTSYSLTWSNSHTDFRVEPNFSTTDVTTSPTFSAAELVATV